MMTPEERTLFQEAVYEIVRMVPPGRATSYGAIARAAGFPNHSRMVGKFMAVSGTESRLPAHRVVNSSGVLTAEALFGLPGKMRELLDGEGVTVKGNRIQNWAKVFWDPLREIGLDTASSRTE